MITGFMYIDYNSMCPSNISIIDGGIGHPFVKIKITTKPAMHIRSTFGFFYERQGVINLENYFESNIDINL